MKISYSFFSKSGRITKVEPQRDGSLKLTVSIEGSTASVELSAEDQNALRPHLQPPAPRRSGA